MIDALVQQKDILLQQINEANQVEELEQLKKTLGIVSIVWDAMDYSYKTKEVLQRIRDKAQALLEQEEQYLSSIRKNDRTRNSTLLTIARLKGVCND